MCLLDDADLAKPLPPILHYASPAPSMTKYDMTVIIGKHLKLPIDHIAPNTEKPAPGSGTQRPENTELSLKKLEEIGVSTQEAVGFDAWWGEYARDIKA